MTLLTKLISLVISLVFSPEVYILDSLGSVFDKGQVSFWYPVIRKVFTFYDTIQKSLTLS